MFERYVSFVDLIRPKFLVCARERAGHGRRAFQAKRQEVSGRHDVLRKTRVRAGKEIGYAVTPKILDASNFGVPQRRARLVVVGIEKDVAKRLATARLDIFGLIENEGQRQLSILGNGQPVTAEQALSDSQ